MTIGAAATRRPGARAPRASRVRRATADGAPPGIVRRALTTNRHLVGLAAGALVAHVRARRAAGEGRGVRYLLQAGLASLVRPLLRRDFAQASFPVQFRRRLELLGPTYIKLGQILSLREDLLPRSITEELRNLLDGLPAVPFAAVQRLVERELGGSLEALFLSVDPEPIGSASIAQIHRATTLAGDPVVLKVVKPGIPETLRRDARLLRILAAVLQVLFPRYQPRRIIGEFVDYTQREVDLRQEAENTEMLAANFHDLPGVVFPRVYTERSSSRVLCLEYIDGLRPDTPQAQALPRKTREQLVDLGAAAIIRMLYRDGFFHADLHPANLLILPGARVGFIDLGMVGRLDAELRRTLLYYYYSLVTGDAENAARYLSAAAEPGRGGDPQGFRRDVSDIARRWRQHATFREFSLGRLVLESLSRGARYRMYFPVELVLMVKALITFEGVGHVLLPGFDVAEVSRRHIREIFLMQFSPWRVLQEELRGAPDLVDALMKVPLLVTEGVRVLEKSTRRTPENPFAGMRGTVLAGFAIVAGAILVAFAAPWPVWVGFFVLAPLLALRRTT